MMAHRGRQGSAVGWAVLTLLGGVARLGRYNQARWILPHGPGRPARAGGCDDDDDTFEIPHLVDVDNGIARRWHGVHRMEWPCLRRRATPRELPGPANRVRRPVRAWRRLR